MSGSPEPYGDLIMDLEAEALVPPTHGSVLSHGSFLPVIHYSSSVPGTVSGCEGLRRELPAVEPVRIR